MAGNARAMRRSAFHTVRVRQLRGGCPGLCGGLNKSGAILSGNLDQRAEKIRAKRFLRKTATTS